MVAAASSYPDLKFPQYRVKRKPAPTVDVEERYPSPDPADPFAPLWALRNRTSSVLGQNQNPARATPSPNPTHGPYGGSQETLNNPTTIPVERRRSQSYLLYAIDTPGSVLPASSPPRPTASTKMGHYRPHSQMGLGGGGGAFSGGIPPAHILTVDSIPAETHPQKPLDLSGPPDKHSWPIEIATKEPAPQPHVQAQRRTSVNGLADSSGTETESDASVPPPPFDVKVKAIDRGGHTTTTTVSVSVDPSSVRRGASNGGVDPVKTVQAQEPQQHRHHQGRLARFLVSKKTSHDASSGYMADGEKKSRGNAKPVHKASISAPLATTFVHHQAAQDDDKKSYQLQNPAPIPVSKDVIDISRTGGYASDTDVEDNSGAMRVKGTIDAADRPEAIAKVDVDVEDIQDDKHPGDMSWSEVYPDEYFRPSTPPITENPRRSYPTPAPSPTPSPPPPKAKQLKKDEDKPVPPLVSTTQAPAPASAPLPLLPSSDESPPLPSKSQKEKRPKYKTSKGSSSTATPHAAPSSATATPEPSPPAPPPRMFKQRPSSASGPQPVAGNGPYLLHPHAHPQTHQAHENGEHSTMTVPPIGAVPSTHSISNSSIVNVSISTPWPAPEDRATQPREEEGAYVMPRPAPKPPAASGRVKAHEKEVPVEGVVFSEPEVMVMPKETDREVERDRDQKEKEMAKEKEKEKMRAKAKTRSEDDTRAIERRHTDATAMAKSKRSKQAKAATTAQGSGAAGDADHDGPPTYPTSVSGPVYFPSTRDAEVKKASPPPLPPPSDIACAHRPPPSSSSFWHLNNHAVGAEYAPPTHAQLLNASSLPVYAEDGSKVSFGSLFAKQKTAVVFIRHFWCPLCQDYMSVVSEVVKPEMLVGGDGFGDEDEVLWRKDRREREKIGFVVISNGAHGMIAKYRQIFTLPFRVYTDPSLALYKALGMGRDSKGDCNNPHGPYHSDSPQPKEKEKKRLHYRRRADTSGSMSDRDGAGKGYVKHGLMSGIAMVVVRAIKVGMPVWEKGGDVGQLGGEFVLGPGLTCSYAHRMQSTKGHAPIQEVLQAAGIQVDKETLIPPSPPAHIHTRAPVAAPKHTHSIDLASPPRVIQDRPSAGTGTNASTNPVRRRRESLKALRDTLARASTIGTSTAPQAHTKTINAPMQASSMNRRDSRRNEASIGQSGGGHGGIGGAGIPSSVSAAAALITREDEERWMEDRQRSIEKMQERKYVRRVGALGRAPSSQSVLGPQPGYHHHNHRDAPSGGQVQVGVNGSTIRAEGNRVDRSRSPPARPLEEEKIVYKAESRRLPQVPMERAYPSRDRDGHAQRANTTERSRTHRTNPVMRRL